MFSAHCGGQTVALCIYCLNKRLGGAAIDRLPACSTGQQHPGSQTVVDGSEPVGGPLSKCSETRTQRLSHTTPSDCHRLHLFIWSFIYLFIYSVFFSHFIRFPSLPSWHLAQQHNNERLSLPTATSYFSTLNAIMLIRFECKISGKQICFVESLNNTTMAVSWQGEQLNLIWWCPTKRNYLWHTRKSGNTNYTLSVHLPITSQVVVAGPPIDGGGTCLLIGWSPGLPHGGRSLWPWLWPLPGSCNCVRKRWTPVILHTSAHSAPGASVHPGGPGTLM